MSEDATTKPTIETVLERIAELRDTILDFRQGTETRLATVEAHLIAIEAGAVEIKADVVETKADVVEMKAGVVEMKADVAMVKEEQKRQVLQMDLLTKDMHKFATDLYDLRYEYHKSTQ